MLYTFLVGFLCLILWAAFVDSDLVYLFYDFLHSHVISHQRRRRSLGGKVVWITGASSGIGEAVAYDLAQYGCRLILTARREEKLLAVKQKCVQISKENCGADKFDDSEVVVLPFDVLLLEEHDSLVEQAFSYFNRIDILINNAGRTQRCTFSSAGMDVLNAILKLNFTSHVSLTRHVVPIMKAQNYGMLVNINSVAGIFGANNSTMYCASKFALRGLWDSLRLELAQYNINVLTVCPGPVQTPLFSQAFTEDINVCYGQKTDLKETPISKFIRLTPERCAQVVTFGVVSELKEIWIATSPVLFFLYLMQYCPTLFLYIGPYVASRGLTDALRDPDVTKKGK